jgi:hypothetical protein
VAVHPAGTRVKPHIHRRYAKVIEDVQEVIYIEHGRVEVELFSEDGASLGKSVLNRGDTIILVCGGHAFTMLEDVRMIEVKQGPYKGVDDDKRRF